MRKLFYIFCLFLFPSMLMAQAAGKKRQPSMRMIGRADSSQKAIYLRWASASAQAWKINNKYGFILERYTVIRNKQMLAQPEKLLLTPAPLKPAVLEEWETLAKLDGNAAVIAQALFGSGFDVSVNEKGAAKIMAQSQEMEQRFSFSLYAADNSFEGALLAGWGFIDKNVKPEEKYLYRLKPAAPANLLMPDSVGVFISPVDYEPLPAVQDLIAQFGNKAVLLSWDIQLLSPFYASYYVERSEDGGRSFTKLNGLPVSSFDDRSGKQTRMYLMDSLRENGKEYQYRVLGVNPFGQTGPASAIIKGMGKEVLSAVPNIRKASVDNKSLLHVHWIFDEKYNHTISGFVLKRADNINGPYELFGDTLSASLRHAALKKELAASNYFTISAIAKEGGGSTSFPVLVQPEDSIPPAIPVNVKALIDSNGVVTISWDKNNEGDLMGYKIFRAQMQGEELVPLVDSVWFGTSFKDTLSLKMLNKRSYYAVTALDHRFNQSEKSELVEVKKPDVAPPSPAVITRFRVNGNSVTLNWICSSDTDLASHAVMRTISGDTSKPLELISFAGRSLSTFTDKDLTSGKTYNYYLVARSEGGLTTASEELKITIVQNAGSPSSQFTKMYAYAQPDKRRIEITWDHQMQQVVEYQVYRAETGKQLALWKVLPAAQMGIYDTDVQPNTEYQYAVMAVFRSGSFSSMKTVSAKY